MMDSEKLSQRYWEQVPHGELAGYAAGAKTRADLAALERILRPADRVLDLGCGWGRMALGLASRGYDVVGVDLSANLIAYARRQTAELGLDVAFEVGSMLAIPQPDAAFDRVVCLWGVFNHLLTPAEQVQAMNEMHRVLKPGGLAFIEMGNGERKKYRQILATETYGPDRRIWNSQFKKGPPPNVLYIHDRGTLARAAAASQFESFRVGFQNINHRRRIVACLRRGAGENT